MLPIKKRILKLALSLVLVNLSLLPLSAAASEATAPAPGELLRIERLLNSGLERHNAAIQAEAALLDLAVREQLYAERHKQPVLPMLINLFMSLGLGSALQGDIEGFLWEMGTEMLGAFVLGATMIGAFQTYAPVMGPDGPQPRPETPAGMGLLFGAGAFVGGGLIMGGKVYGLIRPFSYASSYNQQLSEALLLNQSGPLSLGPLPDGSGLQLSWHF